MFDVGPDASRWLAYRDVGERGFVGLVGQVSFPDPCGGTQPCRRAISSWTFDIHGFSGASTSDTLLCR